MRIISGKFKGRVLNPPGNLGIRPTTDRMREAIFNILVHSVGIYESRILELFAGSGAVSLEFISRGASSVTSIEKNAKTCRYLQTLQKDWQVQNWQIIHGTAEKFIQTSPVIPYDLIFLDPPYQMPSKLAMVYTLLKSRFLTPEGFILLEHPFSENYQTDEACLDFRKFSNSGLSFFGYTDSMFTHNAIE